MIPVPDYLRKHATDISIKDKYVDFRFACACGNKTFSVSENCLSPEEETQMIPLEKACKKLACGMWGAATTVDDEGKQHHWKLLTPFGLKGWKKEIILPPWPLGAQISIVKCKCLSCGQEHTLFDSRYHGYDGICGEKSRELLEYAPRFRCVRKSCQLLIRVFNDPAEQKSDLESVADGFDAISVYAASETGKKTLIFGYDA